jgi:hypothetical protein
MSNMQQCAATYRKNGVTTKCDLHAKAGSYFCDKHDKKSKAVVHEQRFMHGLKSPYRKRFSEVGRQLLDRINELREDPDLFSLKDDAAFVTALMDIKAASISDGISVDHYNSIKSLVRTVVNCAKAGDFDQLNAASNDLMELIDRGADALTASDEVVKLIEKRTSIIEAEQRMLQVKAYTLEVDQAFSLVMQVYGLMKTYIKSPEELRAINTGINKLVKQYQDQEEPILDAEIIDENNSQ